MSAQKFLVHASNSEYLISYPPIFGRKIYTSENNSFLPNASSFMKTMLCRLRTSRPLLLVAVLLSVLGYLVCNHAWNYTEPVSFVGWSVRSERKVSVYVRPLEVTALLSPHVLCTGDEFLVVVVPSSPGHWERRKAIRSTYGQWLRRVGDGEALTRNLLELNHQDFQPDVTREDYLNGVIVPPRSQSSAVEDEMHHESDKLAGDTKFSRGKREAELLNSVHEVSKAPSESGGHSTLESTTRVTSRGRVVSRVQSSFAPINPALRSRLFFILGRESSVTSMSASLVNEQETYGDILVEDFIDSYQNLTLKSVFMLKFINSNCASAKFVVKADDDVFLHVPNIQRTLIGKKLPDKLLLGCLFCFVRPVGNPSSKWFSPPYMFRGHYFPNYLSGTSYILSGNLIKPLLDAAMHIPLFHLEDVYITGILAQEIGVRPQDDVGFSYQTRPTNPCLYQNVSMAHDMEPVLMYKLWNSLHLRGVTRSCKSLTASQVRRYSPPTNCKWKK